MKQFNIKKLSNITIFVFLFIFFISISCAQEKLIYIYSDGSGNTYTLDTENMMIEYDPVKPEFSSSSIYDGGEYIKKKINAQQFKKIISNINNALINSSLLIH